MALYFKQSTMPVHAKRFRKCMAIALWLGIALPVSAQNAEAILTRYLKTVSNDSIDKWARVRSVYIESASDYRDAVQPDFSIRKPAIHKTYRVWPDRYRNDVWVDATLVTSHFTVKGNSFLVMGQMDPISVAQGPYGGFEFDAVRIRQVMDKARRIVYSGIDRFPSGDCHHIQITTKALIWQLYINAETFFLDYWSNTPVDQYPDSDASLTRVYDYRQIGGLWFAMAETKTKKGVVFFRSDIKKIDLNPVIPDSVFNYRNK